jgi:DNA-directed RNA polymerase specialized sigma subunit
MSEETKPTPKKRRRKRRKNDYFTHVHQDAIVKYAQTEDNKIRTQLYVELIGPALDELVDKIVHTYKFTNLPNIDSLKAECKIWLTTILDKFDESKGSKAFSYYSVITKNWFIHKTKKNSKRSREEISFETLGQETQELLELTTEHRYLKEREYHEFWQELWKEINSWEHTKMKENERKVFEAVKILLESHEDIEIFNKKAIYLYLREMTDLNTKQIVNNLNKMRAKYRTFKDNWNKGEI